MGKKLKYKVKMTIYKVSYKNSTDESEELYHPIIIRNEKWDVNFLQSAFIFLQKWDGSKFDIDKIKAYTVTGYFLEYNDEYQEVSDIQFTERKFLTLTQEEIQKKLENGKSIEAIVELNNNYKVDVSKLINNNYDIKPKNGMLTLEGFLFNFRKRTFSQLRGPHREATINYIKKVGKDDRDLLREALCELSSKY